MKNLFLFLFLSGLLFGYHLAPFCPAYGFVLLAHGGICLRSSCFTLAWHPPCDSMASMMTEPAVTSSLLEFLCCCCSLQSQNCGLWLQAIIVGSWCELTGWNLWARVVCFMHSQGMFHNTKSLGTVITRQHGITEKVIRCEIWTNRYPHMKACCMLSLVNAFCDALHLMDDYTDLWLRYTYRGSVWFPALPMACTDTFLISWHTDL